MAKVLSVRNLQYAYPNRLAVDSVSLDLQNNEIFGLLGPNGAGKTTTISCIAGLLANWKGDLQLNGVPFRPAASVADRCQIGLVPQELSIYDNLTARENLHLFAELAKVPHLQRAQRVSELLRFSGLEDRSNDTVAKFSGGMKRRLNLAAGFVHRPSLVLMDEPTVGVDPQSRNHIFDAIQAIRDEGTTILYTTHYMEEAQRLCDRVAIMNEGKIIAVGTPDSLIQEIGEPNADLEQVFLKLTGRKLRDE